MRATQATTRDEVKAAQVSIIYDRFQRHVLREQVDTVVMRHTDRHLMLAGHVRRAIDRFGALGLDLHASTIDQNLLAVQPEFVVRGRIGHEVVADLLRQCLEVIVISGQQIGARARQRVACNVAATTIGRHPTVVERLDQRLKVGLPDTMVLEILARRDAERVVRILRR